MKSIFIYNTEITSSLRFNCNELSFLPVKHAVDYNLTPTAAFFPFHPRCQADAFAKPAHMNSYKKIIFCLFRSWKVAWNLLGRKILQR